MTPNESKQDSDLLNQRNLALAMREFCRQIPASVGLGTVLDDWDYLYYFEAERVLTVRQALLDSGFKPEDKFQVLDFGYLHGMIPEFVHRFFPGSSFTVFDHPESPNFKNVEYQAIIKSRSYVKVQPCHLERIQDAAGQYDLIILGEIIEHMDPTVVAKAFVDLRKLIKPASGRLLITTPNGGSIRDTILTLLGHDTQSPPIPDATMGYPHIHLWSHPLLKRTLEHFGWRNERVYYNHGRGGEIYAESNRRWIGLKFQFLTKTFHFAGKFKPAWRDFMVSTWRPSATNA